MTRYLISFDDGAMDHIPDEDFPEVGRAAHEVLREAVHAGVWVFGGGLESQMASVVATDGTVTDGPYPETKEHIGGFAVVDVPDREEALKWAAKIVPLDGPLGMGMTFISSMLLLCAAGAASPLLVRGIAAVGGRLSGATGVTGWLAGAFTRAEMRRVPAVAVPLALMFAINAPMLLHGDLSQDLVAKQQA